MTAGRRVKDYRGRMLRVQSLAEDAMERISEACHLIVDDHNMLSGVAFGQLVSALAVLGTLTRSINDNDDVISKLG